MLGYHVVESTWRVLPVMSRQRYLSAGVLAASSSMMFHELQGGDCSITGVSIGMGTPLSVFSAFWPVIYLCIIRWAWQCTSLIPVVDRQEQVDLSELKTGLIYIVNSSQPGQRDNTVRACLKSGGKGSTKSKKVTSICFLATFTCLKKTHQHTHTETLCKVCLLLSSLMLPLCLSQ